MPPGILSSNLITIQSLDLILASPTSSDPIYRHQLLSTKLAILTNRPSQPTRRSFDSELQILQCRLELAKACLGLNVPNLVTAGLELGLVERDCKGIIKRMCRENRIRVDKASRKIELVGGLDGNNTPLATEGEISTTRPAPTPLSSDSTSISTSTNSATSSISGSNSNSSTSKYESRQQIITALRVEALRLLGEVEEMQGKPERRGRWDSLALKLEAG